MSNVKSEESNGRAKRIWSIGLWCFSCLLFWSFLYWGSSTPSEQEKIYFWEYAPGILEKGTYTFLVVGSALLGAAFLAYCFLALDVFRRAMQKKKETQRDKSLLQKMSQASTSWVFLLFSWIPSLLSAIAPFITGIFLIRIFHLDTINSYNLGFAILCLSLFNGNYIYRRLSKKIELAYEMPYVLYAKSLGLPDKVVFWHYVLPSLWRDNLVILRELLPHLTIESVIMEYTFGYSALIRSLVDALIYRSWSYFVFLICAIFLFISFFHILFRWVEDIFPG